MSQTSGPHSPQPPESFWPRGTSWDPEQSVWDEPAILAQGQPLPEGAVSYGAWVQAQRAGFPLWKSLLVSTAVAVAAGPLAVAGTFLSAGYTGTLALLGAFLAPVVEEVMKAALPLWVVRRRPWWFLSAWQIVLTMLASGAAFAAIENVLYLRVYVPNPEPWLVAWRWTVCVGLHTVCTFLSSLGLVRLWREAMQRGEIPQVERFLPWLTAAVLLHLVYNVGAMVWQWLGFPGLR